MSQEKIPPSVARRSTRTLAGMDTLEQLVRVGCGLLAVWALVGTVEVAAPSLGAGLAAGGLCALARWLGQAALPRP